ncbi:hypothetical protein V8C35DRAFT_107972 [Trichoderma chlorosporum]
MPSSPVALGGFLFFSFFTFISGLSLFHLIPLHLYSTVQASLSLRHTAAIRKKEKEKEKGVSVLRRPPRSCLAAALKAENSPLAEVRLNLGLFFLFPLRCDKIRVAQKQVPSAFIFISFGFFTFFFFSLGPIDYLAGFGVPFATPISGNP